MKDFDRWFIDQRTPEPTLREDDPCDRCGLDNLRCGCFCKVGYTITCVSCGCGTVVDRATYEEWRGRPQDKFYCGANRQCSL